MGELRRSEDYYRKMCMVKENDVPSQTEITERLGENISEILFDNCLPALKPFLGLSPPLEGPGYDLWISPSDLLIGKVKLKPPLTSKHIKALTHQGILDIGKDIEKKVENEYDMLRMKALFETEMMLKYQAKKDIRDAVAKVKDEMKIQHDALVEQLKQEFKDDLKAELAALTVKLNTEKELAIQAGKIETEQVMQIKLEMTVAETVQKLTEIFAYELFKQSKNLHKHFWFHIKQEKKKIIEAVKEEKEKGQEKLAQLKTEFECENIANIMYLLATERRRCACEKKAQENNYLARINELEKTLEEQNDVLQAAIDNYEATGREIKNREAILFEIIKQFQKFIYFALKAVPTQAEYLLNVEKLMILEMTKSVLQQKPHLLQSHSYMVPDDPAASTRSIYQDSAVSWSSRSESEASEHNYHNCGNKASFASEAHTLTEDQDLPYFVFNENMYLREDFRNMVSQGLKISESHELWNFELEKVIEYFEPDAKYNDEDDKKTHRRIWGSELSYIGGSISKKKTSNVRFSINRPEIIVPGTEQIIQYHTYDDGNKNNKEEVIEEPGVMVYVAEELESLDEPEVIAPLIVPEPVVDDNEIGIKRMSSKLLYIRDSKELLGEKLKTKRESDFGSTVAMLPTQIAIRPNNVKDSLILKSKKSLHGLLSETVQLLRQQESKLEFARDSKELIKNTLSRTTSIPSFPNNGLGSNQITLKNVGVQCSSNTDAKSVLITHIEFIPEDGKTKISEVNFHTKPKIIPNIDEQLVNEQSAMAQNIQKKIYKMPVIPQSEFKVVGDFYGTEYTEPQDEFTAKRVSSFIRIFKESPSLMHLFTEACSN